LAKIIFKNCYFNFQKTDGTISVGKAFKNFRDFLKLQIQTFDLMNVFVRNKDLADSSGQFLSKLT